MTAGEAITIIYKVLKNSNVASLVTPDIFKYRRKLNFQNKCIVINSVSLTEEQFQAGYFNVNYYEPNLVDYTVTPVDKSQPNASQLESGAEIIKQALTDVNQDSYHIEVKDTTILPEDDLNQWFANIRVLFKNVNL